eukprot:CAMPEP_0176188276 /NCGR_PEP_ID=MMETSP0121_2-20121125/2831_1 /TAXON_ID=160619 /ORGANISM="Kryptoperidinium foliaceum, Strain CCMP 1326" /LENGTH=43 /DNA_ID= /DNA_START= /DNA_END= /DNA_ORIENTATION=
MPADPSGAVVEALATAASARAPAPPRPRRSAIAARLTIYLARA